MSNLEDLVPPLELCRKIPFPKFEDSVLVWDRINQWILLRTEIDCDDEENGFYVPAPTLQEIMDALWKFKPRVWRNKNLDPEVPAWGIALNEDNFIGHCGFVQENPAFAALKLWLEVDKTYKSYRTNKDDKADKEG